jgi:hypothetical protein
MPKLAPLKLPRSLIAALALGLLFAFAPVATVMAAAPKRKPAPAKPIPKVPQGFVGVNTDGPVYPDTDDHVDLAQQLGLMASSGVQNIRVVFDWAQAQPYASWNDVPAGQSSQYVDVGGIPTKFGALDQIVGLAAQRGLTMLPVVVNSPAWDADQLDGEYEANPRSVYWYALFLQALVQRYGPQGSFWAHAPAKLAIRMWQIWNEPDLIRYWSVQPFADTYVTMLRAARAAIKQADPGAKIVLGGLTNYSWRDLASIYNVKGARSLFDVVAIHPYTKQPKGVLKILGYVRGVMAGNGDRRKPLIADEISWPSSLKQTDGYIGWATTAAGQARNVAKIVPMLAQNRTRLGLAGFYYYTWAGQEYHNANPWNFAGLLDYTGHRLMPKPAFNAFKQAALAIEHCRVKTVGSRCAS